MVQPLRLLLLSDTHLGFDEPVHARVSRRRRGPDFFANFERALAVALRGEVDAVVHGGDLFYRSRVPPALVERAFQPIAKVAARGVPVLVVPGNHERSRIPYPLFAVHRNVFIFDRPRTFALQLAGLTVAFSGFPFAPDVRSRFGALLAATNYAKGPPAVRLLCMHQAVEGARVGTPEFLFDRGPDVIRGSDLPGGCAAVLSGHVHRGQRLSRALDGRPLPAPVFYPGSVERTSFAEHRETKGYLVLRIGSSGVEGWDFHPLPTRPMVRILLQPGAGIAVLRDKLSALPPDAVVHVVGPADCALGVAQLRAIAPGDMNIDFRPLERATGPPFNPAAGSGAGPRSGSRAGSSSSGRWGRASRAERTSWSPD